MWRRLAVYSCGRSHGIDLRLTVFPLSSYRLAPIRAPSHGHSIHRSLGSQTELCSAETDRQCGDKSATPKPERRSSFRAQIFCGFSSPVSAKEARERKARRSHKTLRSTRCRTPATARASVRDKDLRPSTPDLRSVPAHRGQSFPLPLANAARAMPTSRWPTPSCRSRRRSKHGVRRLRNHSHPK